MGLGRRTGGGEKRGGRRTGGGVEGWKRIEVDVKGREGWEVGRRLSEEGRVGWDGWEEDRWRGRRLEQD